MSLEDIKLIAIINFIFHASDFLRLFMMTFTHGLLLSRYSNVIKIETSAVVAPCRANLVDSGIV